MSNYFKKTFGSLNTSQRFILVGFLIGSFFPILGWTFSFIEYSAYPTMEGFILIHKSNPTLWILDLLPILISLGLYYISKYVNGLLRELNSKNRQHQKNFNKLSAYVKKIGDGNLDAEYASEDGDNALGSALVQMANNLKLNSEKEKEENWVAIGRDRVSRVLGGTLRMEDLAHSLLSEIIDFADFLQGAFFIATGDDPKLSLQKRQEAIKIEMIAHFAYGRKKYTQGAYKLGEGLIGESAIEQLTIHRTEIPEDHMTVTSGLIKDKKPGALLIVPLIANDSVLGVMEFAALQRFTEQEIRLVEELAEIIARNMFNLRITERTSMLLEESQLMTRELKEQQVQLEGNSVEMQAKQEEIEQTNEQLETQIMEVKNHQKRQHVLLTNASEVIAIYDKEGTITYESPAIFNVSGYTPEEMVGNNIFKKTDSSTLHKIRDLFTLAKENSKESAVMEIPFTTKWGDEIILEGIATNMLHEPAIDGIVINFRDITERLAAEREFIVRAKMQSLSENSNDVIVRLDLEGVFQYANPMFQIYTGFNSESVLNKSFTELEFTPEVTEMWETIISKSKDAKVIEPTEVLFDSSIGLNTMLVTAIQEYNDENELDSILVVANNITKIKEQQVLLEKTNKKITDSINYAEQIQSSIIPTPTELKEALQDYFLFYKPRDVVSGDFPWIFKRSDQIYFAAVDCTGHGVPGAMMSMIGNLLLNDVVNNEEMMKSPSQILANLHAGVVRTLRQDSPGNKAADGMDIALCQLDENRERLIFSGAHLPLFLLRKGELITYKGDRFPVGGLQYRNRNKYSDHIIDLEKGDKIFIFSDGIIDQIGGENKKKWMKSGLQKFILENKDLSMEDFGEKIDNHFTTYMNTNKQIDDVILFGVEI